MGSQDLQPTIMPSNVTKIVCDIVPVWSGYIWGAQGGVTFDICSLFLVTVPPFLALYFGFLYLQTTLENQNNIVDRIDKKVFDFNRRVENTIRHLRSKEFQNQVQGFTEGVVSTFNKVPIPKISFQT